MSLHFEMFHGISAFFKEFSLGGGGANQEKKPSGFGERARLKRGFVKL
jgi:hypothetical protein